MSAANPSNVSRYPPGRPATSRDVEIVLNGRATYLGVLVSAGTAVNNATTATVFNNEDSATTVTLKGKTLLVQATAAGHILSATTAAIGPGQMTVTTFATVPPAALTSPGMKLQAEERVPFLMGAQDGWLQFIPTSGSASLFVWELT